jgi:hypothetical protein
MIDIEEDDDCEELAEIIVSGLTNQDREAIKANCDRELN